MTRLIIITICLLTNIVMYSQVIVESDSICQYWTSDILYSFQHTAVKNQTNQLALCWFTKKSKQKKKDQFYNYFIALKNDFSLYNIITEYGSTLEIENPKLFPKLFETFYKVIEPFSIFNIYILTDNPLENWDHNITIQTILIKDVKKYFDDTMIKSLRKLSYNPNEIIIFTND